MIYIHDPPPDITARLPQVFFTFSSVCSSLKAKARRSLSEMKLKTNPRKITQKMTRSKSKNKTKNLINRLFFLKNLHGTKEAAKNSSINGRVIKA